MNQLKTMKMKKLIYLILPAITLAACSKEENLPVGEDLQIKMNVGIDGLEAETRGDGMINSTLTTDLSVGFARVDQDNSPGTYDATYRSAVVAATVKTDKKVAFTVAQNYNPNTANKTKLIGFYPSGTWTQASRTITNTVDGTTDVMYSNAVEGNKSTAATPLAITFKHALTQVNVHAYALSVAAKAAWGEIEKVEIVKVGGQECIITLPITTASVATEAGVTFNPSTATVDMVLPKKNPTGNTTINGKNSMSEYTIGNGVELPTSEPTKAILGYAMFAPWKAAAGKLSFKVTTSKEGEITVEVPTAQDFLAGNAYAINLKFSATDITATATITPWNTGGAVDITI